VKTWSLFLALGKEKRRFKTEKMKLPPHEFSSVKATAPTKIFVFSTVYLTGSGSLFHTFIGSAS
jgi:hypothetical protein